MINITHARAAALHAGAILTAIIVFAVIFTYTGDADLLFAITGGFGTGLVIYLTAHIFHGPSEIK